MVRGTMRKRLARREVDYADIYKSLSSLEPVLHGLLHHQPRSRQRRPGHRSHHSSHSLLPRLQQEVSALRSLLEKTFLAHIRQLLPDLPGELVRMIFQYSQRAPYCLTIGHFTPTPATQECESLQLEKFQILLTQLGLSLPRCLQPRARYPPLTTLPVEVTMKAIIQDARAWRCLILAAPSPPCPPVNHELLFSSFSPLPPPSSCRASCRSPCRPSSVSCYLTKSSSRRGRRAATNPFSGLQQAFSLAPFPM